MCVHSETLPSGYRIEIEYDQDAGSPCKEWDMLGTMLLSSRCRYDFGHSQADNEEIRRIIQDQDNLVLPIYMYDHSGITINTTGFSCPWDSGQVGIIYCSKKKAVEEFGKVLCTKAVRDKALACMRSEVESVDQYVTGQVYGYKVLDPNGNEVDSCWGFYGEMSYCLGEAKQSANYYENERGS